MYDNISKSSTIFIFVPHTFQEEKRISLAPTESLLPTSD